MEAPRAEVNLFCDTYDTKLNVKQHVVKGKLKIEITMEDDRNELPKGETKKEPISVSLYEEETEHLIAFLRTAFTDMDKRNDPYQARIQPGKN